MELNDLLPRSKIEAKLVELISEILRLSEVKVGIEDNFFKLGGDSISAIKLAGKLNNEFKSDIKISDVFRAKTIKDLSILIKAGVGNFIYTNYLISKPDLINLFKPFALTNVQQAYYLGRSSNFELGNVSTHLYLEYKFTFLNLDLLEKSFNQLINRHLGLRTIFVNGYQQYLQTVPAYKIEMHELSSEEALLSIRDRLSHKVYSPEIYPLFDIAVSKLTNYYILHVSIDFLLMDANSFSILFKEWVKLYNNLSEKLNSLAISYRDYISQYEEIRASKLFENAKKYWIEKLDDYNLEIGLPLATSPSKITTPKFARITKTISADIWNKLLDKSKQNNISPTVLILEAYGKVLSYFSGQSKVCINLTLFNRVPLHEQINEIIGDFTILELFNYVDNHGDTITKQLQNTHDSLWRDIEHNLFDGIDFQRLIKEEKLIPGNSIIAPVVLTSILGDMNKGLRSSILDLPLDKSYQGIHYSISQTPQVWIDNKAYENEDGFVAEWDYVEQLFDKEVIEAMHSSYCKLIESLAEVSWDTDLLPYITIPIKDKNLIETANCSKQEVSSATLFSRYESIITKNDLFKNTAVIDIVAGTEFTYKKLIEESDLLSRYILVHKDQAESQSNSEGKLIGILSAKGYNQVISTLAIMKSGHSYLPLSVDWPTGRLDEVLEQGETKILLISRSQYEQVQVRQALSKKYQLLVIEDILLKIRKDKELKSRLNELDLPIVTPDDIAYVIFTSGSTGKPKGVTISHRGALNTIDAVTDRFNITEKDKILALSELSFDLSVYDIFGILAAGGTIIFPEQDKIKDPKHWIELVHKYQITIWDTVPQLASLLIDEVNEIDSLVSLRLFLLSGDWLPINLPKKIKMHYPKAIVMSLGGATEGSIWSIWYEIDKVEADWDSIPYGVAMPNQKMYVLNHFNEYCPIGVSGEIHIGGVGVALNYFGDQEKTNASFIDHKELGRLYKTGDLGKWHKDGYIKFIGRKDNQVKLNGYRVELGEIAVKLAKLDEIEEAIVKIQKTDDKDYLVGYLLLNENKKKQDKEHNGSIILRETINKELSKSLPEYMLPYDYIILDTLPLSSNGKLEVNKLPLLQIQDYIIYTAPRNEVEAKMCQIYAEVLHLSEDKVGIMDDFFRLGGNSLLAMQLVGKINRGLGTHLKLNDLYKYKIVRDIADNFHTENILSFREVETI